MGSLGNRLREAREAKGLSPQDIFNSTRIRANVLEALEAEDYDNLPAPVYVRGLLRTLAKPLELEAAHLLALYEAAVPDGRVANVLPMMAIVPVEPPQHVPQRRDPQQEPNLALVVSSPRDPHETKRKSLTITLTIPLSPPEISLPKVTLPKITIPPLTLPKVSLPPHILPDIALPRGGLAGHAVWRGLRHYRPTPNVLLSSAVAVLFLIGIGWGGSQLMRNVSEARVITAAQPEPTPTLAFALNPTTAAPPTATPAPTAIAVTPTPLPRATSLNIQLDVSTRSWMRVEVDGAEGYEGILEAGQNMSFTAHSRVTLRAGNAAGVKVSVNGQSEGALGASGEVVDRQWQLTDTGTVGITPPTWTNDPGPVVPTRKP